MSSVWEPAMLGRRGQLNTEQSDRDGGHVHDSK